MFKIHNFSGNPTQVLWNGGEKHFNVLRKYVERNYAKNFWQKIAIIGFETGYYQNENEAVQRHNNNPKHHWPSDPFLQDSIQGHAFYG